MVVNRLGPRLDALGHEHLGDQPEPKPADHPRPGHDAGGLQLVEKDLRLRGVCPALAVKYEQELPGDAGGGVDQDMAVQELLELVGRPRFAQDLGPIHEHDEERTERTRDADATPDVHGHLRNMAVVGRLDKAGPVESRQAHTRVVHARPRVRAVVAARSQRRKKRGRVQCR